MNKKIVANIYSIVRHAARSADDIRFYTDQKDEENISYSKGRFWAYASTADNLAHEFNIPLAPIVKEVIENTGYNTIALDDKGWLIRA